MSCPDPPPYLDDALVRAVLEALLTRADRQSSDKRKRLPQISLDERTTPAWFATSDGTAKQFSWRRLNDLADSAIVEVALASRARYSPTPWTQSPSIRLTAPGEERVRTWLHRPFPVASAVARWRQAVHNHPALPAALRDALLIRPLVVGRRPAAEVLSRLLRAQARFCARVPRRVVSAKTFWGLSKLLDTRDDLLTVLAENPTVDWRKRPLLMHVHAPIERPNGLLFVENLEAFDALCSNIVPVPAAWWVLYAAGFKASSQRLVDADNVRWFSAVGAPQLTPDQLRTGIVLAQRGECAVTFWGDLDYAGLAILRELRRVMPDARAWEPGYRRLHACLVSGDGHTPEESHKAGQRDPGTVGCEFADTVLLPAIRERTRFVDQEAVCLLEDWT